LPPRDERGQDAQANIRGHAKEPDRLRQRERQSWHVLELLPHAQYQFFSSEEVPAIRFGSKRYRRELNGRVNVRAERFGVDGGKRPAPGWLGVLALRHELTSRDEGTSSKVL
jgi:hypothetical protein